MQLKTKKGYDFFEASSSFQKAIRRGIEPTALYFAVEFFNSNYEEYVWKRMLIIASEDVGLGDPMMCVTVQSLYQSFALLKKDKKEGRPERIFFIHAVIALTRAKKSRLVDLSMIVAWRSHDANDMNIPDYAYDKHTLKGKKMGHGLEHFFADGMHVENHNVQPGEVEMKKMAFKLIQQNPGKLALATADGKSKVDVPELNLLD